MGETITELPIDAAETLRVFGYAAKDVTPGAQQKVIIRCTVCGAFAPRKRRSVTYDVKCRPCSARSPARISKVKATISRRGVRTGRPVQEIHADPNRKVLAKCCRCGETFSRHWKKASKPNWRCARCAMLDRFAERSYPCEGLPIDAVATFKQFGYQPEWLKPTSNRTVVIRCTVCSKTDTRARGFVRPDVKCLHCCLSDPAVTAKKQRTLEDKYGADAQELIGARRKATIRERYDETPFKWTRKSVSGGEHAVSTLIEGVLGPGSTVTKILPSGRHIDVYVAAKKVGVEYHGLYYHHELSPNPRKADYHAKKLHEARKEGIRLIQIFEDEWRTRRVAVEQIILSALGVYGRRVWARKCTVRSIALEEARDFMKAVHLQGASKRAIAAQGLFFGEELVGAATLAKHHRQVLGALVLDRLCFARGVQVVGGAGRLFAALANDARRLGAQQLITWSDNRWSEGNVYAKLGFLRDAELPPDYQYVDVANPKERISKQSQKKSSSKCPAGMTEHEWALHRGLARIWDCGKVRWVKPL